jgi:hypothetical protein
MLNTVGRIIYTTHRGILYVEHCGKIINIPTLFNIKYFPVFCENKSSHSIQQSISQYFE